MRRTAKRFTALALSLLLLLGVLPAPVRAEEAAEAEAVRAGGFPALRGLLLRRQQRPAPAQHRKLRVLCLGRRHRVAQRRGKGHPLGDAQAARQIARHRRLHRIPDEDPRHAGARLHRDALRAGRIHRAGQRGPAGRAARQRLVLRGARHGPAGKGRQNAEIARRGRRPDPERRRDRLERLRGAGAAALQRELRAEALAA